MIPKILYTNRFFTYSHTKNTITFWLPTRKLCKWISFSVHLDKDPMKEISFRVFFYKYLIEFEFQCLWIDIYLNIGEIR